MRTYKFKLYPTSTEQKTLFCTLNSCRHVYNKFLEIMNNQRLTKKELSKFLTNYKKTSEGSYLNNHYSKAIQPIIDKLFSSIKGLSNSKKNGHKIGRLRFKSRNRYNSFCYNQSGFKIIPTDKRYNKLHLSKIGEIRFKQSRPIIGTIKQVQVKLKPSGWHCYIITDNYYECKNLEDNKIGIDLGVINYLTDSNGNKTPNPLYLKQSLFKLRFLSKQLSNTKKGSKNRKKAIFKLLRLREKISNQKSDFFHKITTKLVQENSSLYFEDLNIKSMVKKTGKNKYHNMRNILDSSWATFINMLQIKVSSTDSELILVDPKNTSKMCSVCGNLKTDLQLSDRTYNCKCCGISLDRDHNAAINIYSRGQELSFVGEGTLVSSMNQESPSFREG